MLSALALSDRNRAWGLNECLIAISGNVSVSNKQTRIVLMTNHSVELRVMPFLRIECQFWLTDDGWNGSSEQPSITVQSGSFEHEKSEMEMALSKVY
jgi:hypothetical protein